MSSHSATIFHIENSHNVLFLSLKSMSLFCWPMQQAVLKRASDSCDPSDTSFDMIILEGTVRFEDLTAVTKGCCL